MKGKNVAIFGAGRSGLAVASAVRSLGGTAIVVDESDRSLLGKPESADALSTLGIYTLWGWKGEFSQLTIEGRPLDFIVANPAIDKRHAKLRDATRVNIPILSEVEFAYRIARAPIVAVTGTNGKSTTAAMTWNCLRACGYSPHLCGNIFGSGYEERSLTDAALSADEDEVLVAEVSSFQLEWIDQFYPVSAAITCIQPDHLNRYDGFQDYARTKLRIFENLTPDNVGILRTDIDYAPSKLNRPQFWSFGDSGTEGSVGDGWIQIMDRRAMVDELGFSQPQNLLNAVAAGLLAMGFLLNRARNGEARAASLLKLSGPSASAGRQLKVPEEVLVGLSQFRGLTHRMEWVGCRNEVTIINNSMCTNPDALMKSMQSVGAPLHVLIGGVNKDLDFSEVKNWIKGNRASVYLFGRSRYEIAKMLKTVTTTFETMDDAFAAAVAAAQPGQIVMLAPGCASTDQFRDFRHRGDVFKKMAERWLKG